ncbi:MAG: hypothetical protein ABIQ01_02180 [Pseudolysinimonas sp.]
MAAYVVSGALAVLRTDKGNERYVYRGGVIESTPDTEASIKHLLSVGLIEEATDAPTSGGSASDGPYDGVSNADLKAAVKARNDDGRDDDAKLAPESHKNVDLIAALVADDEKTKAAADSGSGE